MPIPTCDDAKSEQLKEQPDDNKTTEEVPKTQVESESESLDEPVSGIETTPVQVPKAEETTTTRPDTPKENAEGVTPESLGNNNVVSYNDIIKCLQAKIRGTQVENQRQTLPSPLTYILLPSLATKPC
ncbi:unnamed protein product, partial [Iphiclides podalirius]